MKLTQRLYPFGSAEFTLEPSHLQVRVRKPHFSSDASFPYREFAADQQLVRSVAVGWFASAALLLVGAAICAWLALHPETDRYDRPAQWIIAGTCSVLAVVLALIGTTYCYHALIFFSSRGQVWIRPGRPDAVAVEQFAAALRRRIESALADAERPREAQVVRQLLRRLRQDGLIDKWSYSQAVERYLDAPEDFDDDDDDDSPA